MQLDINQLDMEGIIDPRVNISNNQPTTNGSPIDITRAPWDMPSTSQIGIAPRSRSQAGPSGSAGGIAGTPFSTLNPFGSPPHPTSRNGKSRALSSISPKDTLPTTSPFDVERYAVRDTSPHLIPGSSTPAALYPIDTDVHQNPHSQPVSPHWQAPDSWATIPPESERLDGAGESSDEDAGNTTTRRPSFAPIADAPTSGSGTVRKSPSQTLNARAREKSLPQTPITSGLDGGFGKPTQVRLTHMIPLIIHFHLSDQRANLPIRWEISCCKLPSEYHRSANAVSTHEEARYQRGDASFVYAGERST